MQTNLNNNTSPLWDFELLLFTHNTLNKDVLSQFSQEESQHIKDCIELQFKKALNSENYKDNENAKLLSLIVKISLHYALSLTSDIQSQTKEYISLLKELYSRNKDSISRISHIFLLSFYVLQGLFLKENWLGKSFLYHDSDHRLKKEAEIKLKNIGMEDRIKTKIVDGFDYNSYFEEKAGRKFQADLNKYTFEFIKSAEVIEHRSADLQLYLTVDGEEIFRKLSYMSLLVIIKEFIKNTEEFIPIYLPSANLWRARINFLHNKILNEKLTSLQVDVLKQYNAFFEETEKKLETERDVLARLKVEFGNVLLYYYKYEKSLKAFEEAQAIRSLNIKFTGKLGYKTKYQTFQTAQLILETDTATHPSGENKNEEVKANGESESLPQNVALEEDSILLEKPRLADLNVDNLNKEFNVNDQIIVLSLIYHLQKTTPRDDILQEQVSAYLRGIMDKAQNWLVYSMCLYVRSLNEFQRTKTKERSILQLQSLVDQFNDKKPSAYERIRYYYSLYYPSYLELQRTMAEKYMEIGMTMSSSDLFEKLDMLEESVECLAMSGHYEKAKQKALDMIEKKPTAKIICIYGELTGDVSYYEKAWQFSNKKFARAKRSEAKYYFNRNNFEKAIESFRDALQINTYHAPSWFTLGCAYLKTNQYPDAVMAFSQVVSIDETQGEAWANMAASFSIQGKKNEALNALQQAVKHNEKSWRIWQNLMMIALETKKFKVFLEAVERLLKLEQKQCIDKQVLQKVNQVFRYQVEITPLEEVVTLNFYKKRISNIYKLMEDKLATIPYFWAQYQEFVSSHTRYNERTLELEEELSQRGDLEASYKEHVRSRLQDRIPQKDIDERIADLCMKECHCIMIVGWEEDKRSCELLKEAIEKMKVAFARVNNDKMQTQLKIFLDANIPRIEKTLS